MRRSPPCHMAPLPSGGGRLNGVRHQCVHSARRRSAPDDETAQNHTFLLPQLASREAHEQRNIRAWRPKGLAAADDQRRA